MHCSFFWCLRYGVFLCKMWTVTHSQHKAEIYVYVLNRIIKVLVLYDMTNDCVFWVWKYLFIITCPNDMGIMGMYCGVINVRSYIHICSDVYSFLAAPSAPVTTFGTITGLIQESNADTTSQGVLSYQYAARVICVLSQQVDRWVRFGKATCISCVLLLTGFV